MSLQTQTALKRCFFSVYGEFGRMPLQQSWCKKHLFKSWNQLYGTSDDLLLAAMMENARMAREPSTETLMKNTGGALIS
jgi:hypothetical protein